MLENLSSTKQLFELTLTINSLKDFAFEISNVFFLVG
jgi:hypothetical protein